MIKVPSILIKPELLSIPICFLFEILLLIFLTKDELSSKKTKTR